MSIKRAITEFRNVVVNFATIDDSGEDPVLVQDAMPIDAYKAALGRVEAIEGIHATSEGFEDVTEQTMLVTGTLPYQVHVFELTTDVDNAVYDFIYVETVPTAEDVTE